jgi:hypothetical protein
VVDGAGPTQESAVTPISQSVSSVPDKFSERGLLAGAEEELRSEHHTSYRISRSLLTQSRTLGKPEVSEREREL